MLVLYSDSIRGFLFYHALLVVSGDKERQTNLGAHGKINTRGDGMRRTSNRWMLAVMILMYGCAVVTYTFDLLILSQTVKATTADFTGRYDSDGVVAAVAYDGQYIIQGITVRRRSHK